eukprot:TRINITY_DN25610_c0_g2_i1.p1 TRINITY_DN25610_c0_g2~~TRINITY_DN25610_c0_g2_i1.p1  ORF type:complete len:278 (-),score=29.27 TRINITY_DN25610_c0_g2_i1:259-1092(-)
MQEAINLCDAARWSDVLLERVSDTEFLKLNVVAGGSGGGTFDGIQELSTQYGIPLSRLQLARIQIGLERSQLTKFLRMEFKNLSADEQAAFLQTTAKGHSYTHPDIRNCDALENQIVGLSGFWGSHHGHQILYNDCIEQISIRLKNGYEIVRGNRTLPGTRQFNIQAPTGFYIANIYGRSGGSLDQMGVYLKTDRPLKWSLQAHSTFPQQFKNQIRTYMMCVNRKFRNGEIIGTGSQDIFCKIVQNVLLNCGMTVEQYDEMARSLIFNEEAFRFHFA